METLDIILINLRHNTETHAGDCEEQRTVKLLHMRRISQSHGIARATSALRRASKSDDRNSHEAVP